MKKGTDCFKTFTLAGVLLAFTACNTGKAEPGAYIKALEEAEGLTKKVTMGAVDYTFKLVTPEAMALKGTYDFKNKRLDETAYTKRLEELKGFIFLNIEEQVKGSNKSVLKYNVSGRPEYEQRVMYYQFYAANDIEMSCNGRVLHPASYNYENQMDISPVNTAVVAFPDDGTGEDLQVTFDDKIMNNRFVKATFKRADIAALPAVSIK